jgi:uncharacterized membrane-anchored protein
MEKKLSNSSERSSGTAIISARNQYLRLIIALIFVFVFLGIFLLYASWPILTGTTVVLATQPVDPFDPFRGQYMTINYEISRVPVLLGVQEGDMIYVSLDKDVNGTWRYEDVSLIKPSKGVAIKGTVTSIYGGIMRIEYGIEQFFFEQDANVPTRGITVKVKVDSSGNSRVVELLQDNKPANITYEQKTFRS